MKKHRSATISVILTMLTMSAGHVYSGKPLRGVLLALVLIIVGYGGIISGILSSYRGLLSVFVATLILFIFVLRDAAITAKSAGEYELKWYNRWYFYILWMICFNVIVTNFLPSPRDYFEAYKMPSASSFPTLKVDDHFIVDKQYYKSNPVLRGDTVVYWRDDDPATVEDESKIKIIKRIIGLPGESVAVTGTSVLINGKPLVEPYAVWMEGGLKEGEFPVRTVPPGTVFLLGDNRDHSKDSRFYPDPFIPVTHLIGKALYIYWSWNDFSRFGKELK